MPLGPKPDNPPRYFFGWVMLGVACLATIATSPGQSFLVGIFNEPIQKTAGLDATQISLAYLIATVSAAIPLTLVGKASDKFGPRITTGVVSAGLALICFLMPLALNFWLVLIAFFLLRFLGQGALSVLAGHVVALWFERRIGRAEAVRHASMSLAVIVLPIPVAAMVASFGWQIAYPVLGVLVALLTLPAVLLIYRNAPEDIGQELDHGPPSGEPFAMPMRIKAALILAAGLAYAVASVVGWFTARDHDWTIPLIAIGGVLVLAGAAALLAFVPGPSKTLNEPEIIDEPRELVTHERTDAAFTLRQAMATRAFWTLIGVGVCSGLVGTALIFHMEALARAGGVGAGEDAAPAKALAASALVPWGIASGFGAPIFGVLADKVRPRTLLVVSPVLLLVTIGLFLVATLLNQRWAFYAGMGVFGVSQAIAMAASSPAIARWFGRKHHGAIRGFMGSAMVVGTACGPILLGLSLDHAGGPLAALLVFALMAIPLVPTAFTVGPPPAPGSDTLHQEDARARDDNDEEEDQRQDA